MIVRGGLPIGCVKRRMGKKFAIFCQYYGVLDRGPLLGIDPRAWFSMILQRPWKVILVTVNP